MENLEEKIQQIIDSKSLLLYGAKIIAIEMIEGLRIIVPSIRFVGCAVSDLDGNENELMGLPVKVIDDFQLDVNDTCILIALGEKYHEVVIQALSEKGYQKIHVVDTMMRNFIFKRMMQIKLKRLLEN